ncbi:MAG: hypothetical protein ABSB25_11320 [Sedimentisphaerales bacterium]
MKKLLVLALVLSMATMANATLTMTISGATSVAVDGTQTYTIGYTGSPELPASVDVEVLVDNVAIGTIGNGVVICSNSDVALNWAAEVTAGQEWEEAAVQDLTAGVAIATPLFTIDLTGVAAGTVTISLTENYIQDVLWNQIVGTNMASKAVLVTPEPFTMTLLGLGGLFLRRRSK